MKEISEIKEKFQQKRPVDWDMIPDIPLTKNQVVMYMPRQLVGMDGEDDITAAMINNYIKDLLMPRANGKTYSKEHIAYLTAISVFKKSLAVKDIKKLVDSSSAKMTIEEYYQRLNSHLDNDLNEVASYIKEDMSEEALVELAFELAISVYARRTLCEQLIKLLSKDEKKKEKPKKEEIGLRMEHRNHLFTEP